MLLLLDIHHTESNHMNNYCPTHPISSPFVWRQKEKIHEFMLLPLLVNNKVLYNAEYVLINAATSILGHVQGKKVKYITYIIFTQLVT